MQEKSVVQENVADTYDGPSYIIVDKNSLCDIFKYTLWGSCNQSTLKLVFGHKYRFSHQLKLEIKCYINSVYSLASQTVLKNVHSRVQNAYSKLDQNGSNTVTDIAVSFDGTWLTREHTSQISVGCVVDTSTGFVIDYEIMSKYCPACISEKNELGEIAAEYDVWYSGHKHPARLTT
ncbi:uncharacterized protein TNCV_1079581 [Trichonephila clavipes]|nr:uncharacterized protein TNCV_1079581 [Trichonephila clavipes]